MVRACTDYGKTLIDYGKTFADYGKSLDRLW